MTIAARDVRWRAGGVTIVDGVSLDVAPGRMLGVLGPNGSGKSSLLRLLCGLRRVASGIVTLDGADIAGLGRAAVARRVALVEQHAATETPLTVRDVVRLGRTPHHGALSPWTGEDDRLVDEALDHVDLAPRRDQAWHTLSGGERQRAQIARALAQCPTELLLDEPTSHIDIRHQLDILALLKRLPGACVVALHDLNLAGMFCDQLVLMQAGRIAAAGPPEKVLTEARIAAVFDVRTRVEPGVRPHVRFVT